MATLAVAWQPAAGQQIVPGGGSAIPPAAGRNVPAVLDLETAAREVVRWHPAVTEAVGTREASFAEVAEARAGYLPQISAGVGTGYDSRVAGDWRPRPQIGAQQMLFDFGKVESAVAAARAGTRIGHAQLLLAVDDLVLETAYAVIELQRIALLRAAARRQIETIADISKLVTDRYETGATTRSDALQAQSRVDAATIVLTQLDAEARRWASNLSYLLGRDVAPEAVLPDAPEWLAAGCAGAAVAIDTAPAVVIADEREDRAAANLRRSRADRLPTVALAGDASSDIASPFGDRSIYSFGLRLNGNVFAGGAIKARVRGAEATLAAARSSAMRTRLEAGQRRDEAARQIASLGRMVETLGTREAAMRETGDLYRMQYLDMGTRTLVDLLNAEQELFQVRFETANIVHDVRRLQVACVYHAGQMRNRLGLDGTVVRGVTL